MLEAYRLTRKDGAPGIDGVTAADYEVNLEANLLDLLDRIKSGRYRAPPVRRAYIPKADGSQRPLGIPTFEDKVAQRAVTMVLEEIYEQDFLPCSYGFRPGRSAHQALRTLQNVLWAKRLYWVLDIDIRKYFDSISHSHLRAFLDQRVTDGVIRRMIDKWLKAGAVEDGLLRHTTEGSPQGGVISPCLSNIFLHHVLDEWFENEVKPRLRGPCTLVRFADDALMAFDNIVDAKRVLSVLGKRFARYGLTPSRQDAPRRLPPTEITGRTTSGDGWDQLRLPRPHPCLGAVPERQVHGSASDGQGPVCPRGGRGERLVSAPPPLVASRPASAPVLYDAGPLRLLWRWGKQSALALVRQASGAHLAQVAVAASSSRRGPMGPPQRTSGPAPAAASQDPARLRRRERTSLVRNRMREIRTSGTVRGGAGNDPTYSARRHSQQWT